MKMFASPLVIASSLAALVFPIGAFAQSANVKTPNKNLSAKFKSAIYAGSGNSVGTNSVASFLGGGQSNSIVSGAANAVLGGGFGNAVSNNFATVAGGIFNRATGEEATVGGGRFNTAGAEYSTVAGGWSNAAVNVSDSVGGGCFNSVSGGWATIAGGWINRADGLISAIGGGSNNLASGLYATVPGGALGRALHNGSFVWSGDDTEATESFGPYTFTVRCEGGARFYTASGTNTFVSLPPNATSLAAISDSNSKTDFEPIAPREILSKVADLPVTAWHYKHDPNRRYIGPMAQDFRAAFGLGYDDKTISTLDSDGVMFAAIQGLVEELKERDKAMAERDHIIGEIRSKLQTVEERLDTLPPTP